MPLLAARLYGARQLDGAAEQEQLFRQRGLARVRMRDDGEGASPRGDGFEIVRLHAPVS